MARVALHGWIMIRASTPVPTLAMLEQLAFAEIRIVFAMGIEVELSESLYLCLNYRELNPLPVFRFSVSHFPPSLLIFDTFSSDEQAKLMKTLKL